MESITIPIEGMTCGGCVANVERVLKAIDGVQSVNVSLEPGEAVVEFAPGASIRRTCARRSKMPAMKSPARDRGTEATPHGRRPTGRRCSSA